MGSGQLKPSCLTWHLWAKEIFTHPYHSEWEGWGAHTHTHTHTHARTHTHTHIHTQQALNAIYHAHVPRNPRAFRMPCKLFPGVWMLVTRYADFVAQGMFSGCIVAGPRQISSVDAHSPGQQYPLHLSRYFDSADRALPYPIPESGERSDTIPVPEAGPESASQQAFTPRHQESVSLQCTDTGVAACHDAALVVGSRPRYQSSGEFTMSDVSHGCTPDVGSFMQ